MSKKLLSVDPVMPVHDCSTPRRRKLGLTVRLADLHSLEEYITTPAGGGSGSELPTARSGTLEFDEPKTPPKLGPFGVIVASAKFNFIMGVLIVINIVLMSIELDRHPMAEASDVMFTLVVFPDVPQWVFDGFEIFFFVVFGLELFARCAARRWAAARDPSTFVDAFALLPLVLQLIFDLQSGKHLMVLRVVRLIKLCRVFRLIRAFKELQLIAKSFITALRTLVWIGLLLAMVVYCCAMVCTMLVGHNEDFSPDNAQIRSYEDTYGDAVIVKRYWGSIMRSVLTLFQIFTLDDWGEVVRPIVETHHPMMFFFFVAFIFVTSFGLLNLLMGAIVDHTMSVAHEHELEHDRILQEEYKHVMLAAARLFSHIDVDRNGILTPAELRDYFNANDLKRVLEKEMKSLKLTIDYEELADVFQIVVEHWPAEEDDGISLEEFVGAAMRLHGPAKSQDLLSTLFAAKSAVARIDQLHVRMTAQDRMIQDQFRKMRELIASTCLRSEQSSSTRDTWQDPTDSRDTCRRPDRSASLSNVYTRCSSKPSKRGQEGGDDATRVPSKPEVERRYMPTPPPIRFNRSVSGSSLDSSNTGSDPSELSTATKPTLAFEREALQRHGRRKMTATLRSMAMDDRYANAATTSILNDYRRNSSELRRNSSDLRRNRAASASSCIEASRSPSGRTSWRKQPEAGEDGAPQPASWAPPATPWQQQDASEDEVPSPTSPLVLLKSWFRRSSRRAASEACADEFRAGPGSCPDQEQEHRRTVILSQPRRDRPFRSMLKGNSPQRSGWGAAEGRGDGGEHDHGDMPNVVVPDTPSLEDVEVHQLA